MLEKQYLEQFSQSNLFYNSMISENEVHEQNSLMILGTCDAIHVTKTYGNNSRMYLSMMILR